MKVCNSRGLKRRQEAYCGIVIVHLMEAIIMERGLMSRFSNLFFIGLPCAKMLVNTSRCVTNVKEQINSSKGTKCHYKVLWKSKLFDCWGIDFIGPFPSSYSHEYILLVVDYVTKWVEAVAVQHADAKTVIRFLKKNIFSRFGTPEVLISDRGTHFCNAQLTKVLQHYSVKHKVASPYHPQTNG